MTDFDLSEILSTLSPLTLTTAIENIKTDEPLILKSRLGKNVQTMLDDVFSGEDTSDPDSITDDDAELFGDFDDIFNP